MSDLDPTQSEEALVEGPPPAPLAGALSALAGQKGWTKRLRGARIHEHWAEIAGPAVAANVEPVRLHGGVLVVRATSPAWATQLRYLTPQLMARANEVLGPDSVSSVTIQGAPPGRAKYRR